MARAEYTPVNLDDTDDTSVSAFDRKPKNITYSRKYADFGSRNTLLGALAFAIIAVAAVTGGTVLYRSFPAHRHLDPQSILPHIRTIDKTFVRAKPPHEQAMWDDILPNGIGFINIHHPRQYDLPPSMPSDPRLSPSDPHDAETYGLSLWHQLHCLRDLRAAFVYYLDGTEPTHGMMERDHALHCFDYIRQCIECASDTTVEYPSLYKVPGKLSPTIHGYGIVHQCRDFDAIRQWTVQNGNASAGHGGHAHGSGTGHGMS